MHIFCMICFSDTHHEVCGGGRLLTPHPLRGGHHADTAEVSIRDGEEDHYHQVGGVALEQDRSHVVVTRSDVAEQEQRQEHKPA